MKLLAVKILGLISTSLGLSSSFIEDAMGELYQNITISYYPSCPQPELTLGLQSHSDMGFITLLIQDNVAGLQVVKDGEWITVEPESHAILVILGDQTEVYFLIQFVVSLISPYNCLFIPLLLYFLFSFGLIVSQMHSYY